MRFAIITHVIHGKVSDDYFGYEPYVREMNLWIKNVSEVIILAPIKDTPKSPIQDFYQHKKIVFNSVPSIEFTTLPKAVVSVLRIPKIVWKIYQTMKSSDHIHLRCPGNIGLLGCLVQIFFPSKPKTAKYAGNWDPKSKQPITYRLQKWILNNSFLTKNIHVLVYGEWENTSKNIKSFFTASYFEKDKIAVNPKTLNSKISFLFVGSLSNGKQPLYAVKLMEMLNNKGYNVALTLFGDGSERSVLEDYIMQQNLASFIFLKGNQDQETIKKAYLTNHFVVLPSLSEGWPKVVAEGMFWGCLPIATKVSCVPTMLDKGNRGVLLSLNLTEDCKAIETLIMNQELYQDKVHNAILWSRQFTMDAFENEIKLLVQSCE
jgi:glycosyltransferase involved in cell wall biosynthesis